MLRLTRFVFGPLGAVLCAVIAASTLAACAPATAAVGGVRPPVATSAPKSTTLDEKALIAAEYAYAAPADSYLIAVRTGLLPPGQLKDTIKADLQLAKKVLDTARDAYDIGDAQTMGQQIAAATRIINRAKAALPVSLQR